MGATGMWGWGEAMGPQEPQDAVAGRTAKVWEAVWCPVGWWQGLVWQERKLSWGGWELGR